MPGIRNEYPRVINKKMETEVGFTPMPKTIFEEAY